MKSLLKSYTLLLLLCISSLAFATQPGADVTTIKGSSINSFASTASWNLLFSANISTGAGEGNAGVAFTGTEYWISRWDSDTIFTADPAGTITDTFTVAGVTDIRSMTWDGTSIYAGCNTNVIYKINPVSRTLEKIITTGIPSIRYCTFMASANNGGGGFWVGTWDTDFTLVDTSGNNLDTIPKANHGLQNCYGLTYDSVSPGGPFFWAMNHTSEINSADIVQLNASGIQTGVIHNVTNDIGMLGDAGGGIFFQASPLSVVGILQGVPNYLFAYDLTTTSVNERNAENEASVFPNPGTGIFTVVLPNANDQIVSLEILNNSGQIIHYGSYNSDHKLDLTGASPGLYFIRITTSTDVIMQRLILQ